MAIWDDVITERDRMVYEKAGWGQRVGFGTKPALLIIDVNYNFVGDRPEPILNLIERFKSSCGEEGWEAVKEIQGLLPAVRETAIPIIYSTNDLRARSFPRQWPSKNRRSTERSQPPPGREGTDIVDEIAPQEGDIVIYKAKPSVFFATPLMTYLNYFDVDTLLVCGCTTSGCVRATVIEAFSYEFRVAVIQECTFDRAQVSHKINLFDMNAKYADVVSVAEVERYLAGLRGRVKAKVSSS
ncbi:MAG: isochorismatase family protein [Chloroflexi bacterium]|nr:isochorismatase family protein [Chloroflexota bacterium]